MLPVMKTEKAMGTLLKQVAAEVRTDELKFQLRKIGSAFLNHKCTGKCLQVTIATIEATK